ncbi:extracellular solute-binding protein [Labedella endophytica]|uniref:Extracellular solute-binding protein n=1 Tax=Labedella endophytica TaxID=1523160 RepID=A0A3S0VD80_9MICO|nr:extracellular solute-binding protein [Labedella endophytica]RUQ96946.1 extracellular solute-binding protein [Labedella endophytica]
MQRRMTAAAIAAAGLLALTGCTSGGGGGGNTANAERGDITIWYSNNEAEIAWGEQMIEAWNADNPDEQITAQEIPAGSSSEEVIGAAITAGNAPCLIFNTSPAAVPQFEKQGGLVSLSSFEGGDDYITERSGELAEQYASADGSYFQMPWKSNPVVIFYNKAMFAEAGLDPEAPALSTYDEFLETSRTLTEAGVAPFAINPAPTSEFFQSWFDFYPLYAAETGGELLVEDGAATFDSDAGAAVADFWATMYSEGLSGQEQYPGDSFVDGESAMAIAGPWAINYYGEDVDWGVVPVPTSQGISPEETYTFSDAKNIGLYSACENQATAWDVLQFATSEEQDGQLLELTGQMPIRQDLTGTYPDYFEANPAYEIFGDQAERTVEVPNVANSVEIWQTFRDGYSSAVIFGDDDVPAFLSDAASSIDDLVAQG